MSLAIKIGAEDTAASADDNPVRQILVVAGEVSGDHHGAGVVRAWRKLNNECVFFGMGGSYLRDAGMEQLVDSEKDASVMGFTEVFSKLGVIIRAFRRIIREVDVRRPEAAILIDYPDFNLRLAKALSRRGVKVLYYVSPQLWAWRRRRVSLIKKYVKKIAPIFPFEESFYRGYGIDATYVGHPFLDRAPLDLDHDSFLNRIGLDGRKKILALLPGSRKAEVERLLPPMLEAFCILRKENPGLQAVLPVAETLDLAQVRDMIDPELGASLVDGCAREVLAVASAAIVASGTATVEAALSEVPFVVCYKFSPVTYRIAKVLVKGVENFAMVNLIAGRKVVEELLQQEVCGERIASEVRPLLFDELRIEEQLSALREVRGRLETVDEAEKSSAERVALLGEQLLNSA